MLGFYAGTPTPAAAGTYYDPVCNCRKPDHRIQYPEGRPRPGPGQHARPLPGPHQSREAHQAGPGKPPGRAREAGGQPRNRRAPPEHGGSQHHVAQGQHHQQRARRTPQRSCEPLRGWHRPARQRSPPRARRRLQLPRRWPVQPQRRPVSSATSSPTATKRGTTSFNRNHPAGEPAGWFSSFRAQNRH